MINNVSNVYEEANSDVATTCTHTMNHSDDTVQTFEIGKNHTMKSQ